MQRIFDIIFSGIALFGLFPLLIPIIVILRFSGEGEIFFLQKRVGKNGQLFDLYKFATMLKNSPYTATGTITVKNDYRVLPFGRALRKTKINELPQLLNILRGEMSFIGPRPLTPQTFSAYSSGLQEVIQQVRPGLSGVGSIVFRNEESILAEEINSLSIYRDVIAPYKGLLESWYVENQRISTYFFAIFITIWVVIFPKSSLVWRVFHTLPAPPNLLRNDLNYLDVQK